MRHDHSFCHSGRRTGIAFKDKMKKTSPIPGLVLKVNIPSIVFWYYCKLKFNNCLAWNHPLCYAVRSDDIQSA